MKRCLILLIAALTILGLCGCKTTEYGSTIAATTAPVYEFTFRLCVGTDVTVTRLITENVSCLHDYTLQVSQVKAVEQADAVVISGAGLEDFMADMLSEKTVIDASVGIPLICNHSEEDDHHSHDDHHHSEDPHIWLAPDNAKIMAKNICDSLCSQYPQYASIFKTNLAQLNEEFDELLEFGKRELSAIRYRELMTFHEGFAYLAQAFDLTILRAIEEESGREASAAQLIELCKLVMKHDLPSIFTELHGSASAASVISRETDADIFQLDMAMGATDYFDAMYHNINTLKEALE